MSRIYNFSAGPAVMPLEVIEQARDELLEWRNSGMSVMEMSHRGKEFMSIHAQTIQDARELLNIPANYKVIFLQGGAIAQNAIVPMNMLRGRTSADYINTGEWSKKSIQEAQRYCKVNVAASGESIHFTSIPPRETWRLDPNAAYVHICSNETIGGVEYHFTPDVGDVPLVADMSSNIMSRPIDVSCYGLIYAGAQKNIGPAGLTVVIVREDLLGQALPFTPSVFDYKVQADHDSMHNTPSTYSIYIAGLVFQWLKRQGGLAAMEKHNKAKAAVLYDYLDTTNFYTNSIVRSDRSLMNVPFKLRDESLNEEFLKQTQANGLVQLKGHRVVGGMRASIYNAMPIAGVQALVAFMREFERTKG
jgi:phosphoserine aminotransferase